MLNYSSHVDTHRPRIQLVDGEEPLSGEEPTDGNGHNSRRALNRSR